MWKMSVIRDLGDNVVTLGHFIYWRRSLISDPILNRLLRLKQSYAISFIFIIGVRSSRSSLAGFSLLSPSPRISRDQGILQWSKLQSESLHAMIINKEPTVKHPDECGGSIQAINDWRVGQGRLGVECWGKVEFVFSANITTVDHIINWLLVEGYWEGTWHASQLRRIFFNDSSTTIMKNEENQFSCSTASCIATQGPMYFFPNRCQGLLSYTSELNGCINYLVKVFPGAFTSTNHLKTSLSDAFNFYLLPWWLIKIGNLSSLQQASVCYTTTATRSPNWAIAAMRCRDNFVKLDPVINDHNFTINEYSVVHKQMYRENLRNFHPHSCYSFHWI